MLSFEYDPLVCDGKKCCLVLFAVDVYVPIKKLSATKRAKLKRQDVQSLTFCTTNTSQDEKKTPCQEDVEAVPCSVDLAIGGATAAAVQPPPREGKVKFYRSTQVSLVGDLRVLRRRCSNGLMPGDRLLLQENPRPGSIGHLPNFVIGSTVGKAVYLVMREVACLQDAEYYTDNVFFFPSPEQTEDLEPVAAAKAAETGPEAVASS